VGYVDANHQSLGFSTDRVLTCYMPFTADAPQAARTRLQSMDYHQLLRPIVDELEYAHPGITRAIKAADIWIWGHGMIAPRPGFIWGDSKARAMEPIANRIFFAHTDLSGISIFEEAFYQGIRAVDQMLVS
jgi:hypothetical protein